MRTFRLVVFITILFTSYSKSLAGEDFGLNFGLSIQFGTHIDRIGLMYQVYYFNKHLSLSQGSYIHWNIKSLGPKGAYPEGKFQFGIQGQWIENDKPKYLLNEFSNISPYLNSMGYSFYIYLDKKRMSQTTGAIHGTFSNIVFAVDNDALGLNQIDDKFRTGGFFAGILLDSLQVGLQSTLWTGKSASGERINDVDYPSRFGYRDVSNAEYGNLSHGILAFRGTYKGPYNQIARAEAGIDAEEIRHLLQNKIIHDGFSKRIVKSESPHYPMLQQDGSLYLFKSGQKKRSPKPYFQLGLNQSAFY